MKVMYLQVWGLGYGHLWGAIILSATTPEREEPHRAPFILGSFANSKLCQEPENLGFVPTKGIC